MHRLVVGVDVEVVAIERLGLQPEDIVGCIARHYRGVGRKPGVEEREVRNRCEPQVLMEDSERSLQHDFRLQPVAERNAGINGECLAQVGVVGMHSRLHRKQIGHRVVHLRECRRCPVGHCQLCLPFGLGAGAFVGIPGEVLQILELVA